MIIFELGCNQYADHERPWDDEGPIVKQLELFMTRERLRRAVGPMNDWRVSDRLTPSHCKLSNSSDVKVELTLLSVSMGYGLNVKIRALLPPGGHNIPSLDFTSDEKGDAYSVLATDINGHLV